jgi:hypothetical protein
MAYSGIFRKINWRGYGTVSHPNAAPRFFSKTTNKNIKGIRVLTDWRFKYCPLQWKERGIKGLSNSRID